MLLITGYVLLGIFLFIAFMCFAIAFCASFQEDVPPWPACWEDYRDDVLVNSWQGLTWLGRATFMPLILGWGLPAVAGNWLGNQTLASLKWVGRGIYYSLFKD